MLTTQQLHQKIHKLKTKISKANNYLELQTAINDFQKIKIKVFTKKSILKQDFKKGRQSASSNQQKFQREQKQKLIATCQELIKEKMKYFKKIALKKINQRDQSEDSCDNKAKQKDRKSRKSNNNLNCSMKTQDKKLKHSQSDFRLLDKEKYNTFSNSKNLKNYTGTQFYTQQNHSHKSGSKKNRRSSKSKSPDQNTQKYQKYPLTDNVNIYKQMKNNHEGSKRLRISKSFDQLHNLKDSYTFRNEDHLQNPHLNFYMDEDRENYKLNNKYDYNCQDDSKTQVKMFKKTHKNGIKYHNEEQQNNQNELQYYKNKVKFLQTTFNKNISPKLNLLPNNFFPQNPSQLSFNSLTQASKIFDQYHYKLRQKSLELQQLKGRLKYYQQNQQQLRNRIFNEQKRNQDYIVSIKNHVKSLQTELYESKKQNKLLQEIVKQYEYKIQKQIKQKSKYIEQIQILLKQKQKSKSLEQSKSSNLKKQLLLMSQQQTYIKELENIIKQSKIQQTILQNKLNKYQNESIVIKQDLINQLKNKQNLQQLLELKLQEIENYKVQIHKLKREIQEQNEEIKQIKQELNVYKKNSQEEQVKKEKLMKRKVEKLKEVKGLLVGEL